MDRWKGKVAVVTGVSAGIGAAIAEALVISGVKVAGLARRKHRVEELAKKLEGQEGKLYPVKADMSKEEDILDAFKWIKENLGPISILINNAGVVRPTNLTDGDTKMWKEVFDTNVMGLCIATREAFRDMKANNIDGHIIHMNSVFGHAIPPVPHLNMYPVSKFAITGLVETLRQELNFLGSKIKISSISPGGTATEILDMPSMLPEILDFVKDAAVLQPKDVADGVLYILGTPPHVQIHDLIMKAVGEAY